jgi:hypothetical protein
LPVVAECYFALPPNPGTMQDENDKQPIGCTPDYCVKPGANDKLPLPSSEQEINIINDAMQENKTLIPVTPSIKK